MYRQFFELNSRLIDLPIDLRAAPNHPLLEELLSGFNFNDPSDFSAEYARDLRYSSLYFFQFLLLKEALSSLGDVVPNSLNYHFSYFLGLKPFEKRDSSGELLRNPFRPLRKGVSSMLRLHATGAVAAPIEVRLQVLASSRDVIHS